MSVVGFQVLQGSVSSCDTLDCRSAGCVLCLRFQGRLGLYVDYLVDLVDLVVRGL